MPVSVSRSQKLEIVSDYSRKAGKLAAFTETSLKSIHDTNWWTNTLLRVYEAVIVRESISKIMNIQVVAQVRDREPLQ